MKQKPAPCGCKGLAVVGGQRSGQSSWRIAPPTWGGVKDLTVCWR